MGGSGIVKFDRFYIHRCSQGSVILRTAGHCCTCTPGRAGVERLVHLLAAGCASGCPWSMARATAPSLGRLTPGVVQQDTSSGGSVDTIKTRLGPQRVRMSSGERPIGAAKGKQPDTEALCQPPPPPTVHGEGGGGFSGGQ